MWRRPILQIVGEDGADILPKLAGFWIKARWTDKAGSESDEAEIETPGPPSKVGLPARGRKFRIFAGWADEGPILQGEYVTQKPSFRGGPDGERIVISMKSADFVDDLKASGCAHYDEGATLGEIVRKEAKKAGLEAVVDPDLDKTPLPYQLRWNQSAMDFLHGLGARYGATVKPAGGKLVAMKRGGGASAGGKPLETIKIQRRRGFSYECEIEPRPLRGHVAAAWVDPKTGKRKLEKVATGQDGPIDVLPHPFRSQDEARRAAEAAAYERGNDSFSGHFDSPGLPRARAEAPVELSGYGWPIDGPAKAEEIAHEIDASGGFKTSVSVKSGDEDKGKDKKKGKKGK